MELLEIRELKAELEDEILDLLFKFQEKTDVNVSEIILFKSHFDYEKILENIHVCCEV